MSKTTKQCCDCKEIKTLSYFSKAKRSKDGLQESCKECFSARARIYFRTKDGLISRIYGSQRGSSKQRGHSLPTYSKQELTDWLYAQKKFHILFDNWKRLDFQTDYVPSVDRKDDYIGYTLSNIQLTIWKVNRDKGHSDRMNGVNNKTNKSVIQYTKNSEFVAKYHSAKEAKRKTGVHFGNISECCLGNRKSAGGFKWSFI